MKQKDFRMIQKSSKTRNINITYIKTIAARHKLHYLKY